jgi:hypothetical protein
MGRWAQAQRRGTAQNAVTALPPFTSDFDISDDSAGGGFIDIVMTGDPGSFNFWQAEGYADAFPEEFQTGEPAAVDEHAIVTGIVGAVAGQPFSVRARFCDDSGNPLSQWSAYQHENFAA